MRYWNNETIDGDFSKPGTHPFVVEWVWGLQASDGSDKKAVQVCSSLILTSWSYGEANTMEEDNFCRSKFRNYEV